LLFFGTLHSVVYDAIIYDETIRKNEIASYVLAWDNFHNVGKKQDVKQKRLRRGGKNTQKNHTKKVLMTWITTVVW